MEGIRTLRRLRARRALLYGPDRMEGAGGSLIGRADAVAALERLLAERRGRAHLIAVTGEPGIGKTRLLAELAARAAVRARTVLEGRATEFEREIPFALFVDALDDQLGSLPPRVLAPLGGERLAELARAFPALARFQADRVALGVERYRLHRAMRALVELLARRAPLLLVLDDVHWADQASLELLLHLVRRPPRADALLALAYRHAQVAPELAEQLSAAATQGDATQLDLRALTAPETALLLGTDTAAGERLYAASGGNPFFATQLARVGSRDEAGGEAGAGQAEGVPRAVIAAIARELRGLGEAARVLLEGAAVAGDPFDVELATAAAALGPSAAPALLDELLRVDLVRPADAPARFRFRHPIVRNAVYASTGGGWRLAAHARAAAELARRGAPVPQRAHHVERSARPGDAAALAVLREAAAAAAPRAPATAARWYRVALDLTPVEEREQRLALLLALAGSLAEAGRIDEAAERVAEALPLVPREQVATRVELLGMGAGIDHLRGRHSEARAGLLAALASLPPGPSAERTAVQIELAVDAIYTTDDSAVADEAANALARLEEIADPGRRAAAAGALALRSGVRGGTSEGLELTRVAAAIIDGLEEDRLVGRLDAAFFLGTAEWFLGAFEDAARHLERGVAVARATGAARFLVPMLATLASAHAVAGRIQRARATVEDAIDTARQAGPRELLVLALGAACLVETQAGDFRAVKTLGEEASTLAGSMPSSQFAVTAVTLCAGAYLELGEPGRFLSRLRAIEESGDVAGLPLPFRAITEEQRVRALLALGRLDEAGDAARRLEELAHAARLTWSGSLPPRARAEYLLACGQPARAASVALGAADHPRCPRIESACCRLLASRALAAAGDRTQALAELERAHRELAACGADGYRDEAARELRRLGRRIARRGSAGSGENGVAALSGRELEVAQLVAEGMTNRQIAAALFVSESTVEKHLRRAFDKLRVSRRAAVASRLAEARGSPAAPPQRPW